jgi:hypothetical protein
MAWSNGEAGQILMIQLDTNVLLRNLLRSDSSRWFDAQPPESVWTTTITMKALPNIGSSSRLCERSSVRYRRRRPDDGVLRERLRALAQERRRFGYRRLWVHWERDSVAYHGACTAPDPVLGCLHGRWPDCGQITPAGSAIDGSAP